MDEERDKRISARLWSAARGGAAASLRTIWLLLRITIPVSLAVTLLDWSGALAVLARFLAPAMGLLGLPGEAALVLVSGALLNNYSAIAVAGTLALDLREMSVLAIMCLTAHNLVVESAVMRKAGSSAAKMVLLRLAGALVLGWLSSRLLPASLAERAFSAAAAADRPPPAGAPRLLGQLLGPPRPKDIAHRPGRDGPPAPA